MAILPLETSRLLLRPFGPGDADAAIRMNDDPDVVRFMKATPITEEEMTAALRRHEERLHRAQGLDVLAGVLKASGEVVGRYGLQYAEIEGRREVELSYLTDAGHRGRGLATEAVEALLAAAWREGVPRVVALIMPENHRSQRLAERVGFVFEREVTHKDLLMWMYVATPHAAGDGVGP